MSIEVETIRSCKYLFLDTLLERHSNTLFLRLHEAVLGKEPASIEEGQFGDDESSRVIKEIISKCYPIIHKEGCFIFDITFSQYQAYLIENEVYAKREADGSVGEGKDSLVLIYKQSDFLKFIIGNDSKSHNYMHWKIITENQVLHVITEKLPDIKMRKA